MSRRYIQHLRSTGKETIQQYGLSKDLPKVPETDNLKEGEIAINYAEDVEVLSIKNNNDAIVKFLNEKVTYENEEITAAAFAQLKSETNIEINKLREIVEGFVPGEDDVLIVNITDSSQGQMDDGDNNSGQINNGNTSALHEGGVEINFGFDTTLNNSESLTANNDVVINAVGIPVESDTDFSEIVDAWNKGQMVFAKYNRRGKIILSLVSFTTDYSTSETTGAIFSGVAFDDENGNQILYVFQCTVKNDNTWQFETKIIDFKSLVSKAETQSDWNETDEESVAYIQNKPTSLSEFTNDANFATESDLPLRVNITYTDGEGYSSDVPIKRVTEAINNNQIVKLYFDGDEYSLCLYRGGNTAYFQYIKLNNRYYRFELSCDSDGSNEQIELESGTFVDTVSLRNQLPVYVYGQSMPNGYAMDLSGVVSDGTVASLISEITTHPREIIAKLTGGTYNNMYFNFYTYNASNNTATFTTTKDGVSYTLVLTDSQFGTRGTVSVESEIMYVTLRSTADEDQNYIIVDADKSYTEILAAYDSKKIVLLRNLVSDGGGSTVRYGDSGFIYALTRNRGNASIQFVSTYDVVTNLKNMYVERQIFTVDENNQWTYNRVRQIYNADGLNVSWLNDNSLDVGTDGKWYCTYDQRLEIAHELKDKTHPYLYLYKKRGDIVYLEEVLTSNISDSQDVSELISLSWKTQDNYIATATIGQPQSYTMIDLDTDEEITKSGCPVEVSHVPILTFEEINGVNVSWLIDDLEQGNNGNYYCTEEQYSKITDELYNKLHPHLYIHKLSDNGIDCAEVFNIQVDNRHGNVWYLTWYDKPDQYTALIGGQPETYYVDVPGSEPIEKEGHLVRKTRSMLVNWDDLTANFYQKAEVYNKTQIDEKLSGVNVSWLTDDSLDYDSNGTYYCTNEQYLEIKNELVNKDNPHLYLYVKDNNNDVLYSEVYNSAIDAGSDEALDQLSLVWNQDGVEFVATIGELEDYFKLVPGTGPVQKSGRKVEVSEYSYVTEEDVEMFHYTKDEVYNKNQTYSKDEVYNKTAINGKLAQKPKFYDLTWAIDFGNETTCYDSQYQDLYDSITNSNGTEEHEIYCNYIVNSGKPQYNMTPLGVVYTANTKTTYNGVAYPYISITYLNVNRLEFIRIYCDQGSLPFISNADIISDLTSHETKHYVSREIVPDMNLIRARYDAGWVTTSAADQADNPLSIDYYNKLSAAIANCNPIYVGTYPVVTVKQETNYIVIGCIGNAMGSTINDVFNNMCLTIYYITDNGDDTCTATSGSQQLFNI